MAGIQDRLGDLSWLGKNYNDQGWFQVEGETSVIPEATLAWTEWEQAKLLLAQSDWTMLSDVPMSVA